MDFFVINEKYINFLKRYELENRGVTKVPDVKYHGREKFAFGVVLENEERICKKAKQVYEMVIHNRNPMLTRNRCDFKALERGYREYVLSGKMEFEESELE